MFARPLRGAAVALLLPIAPLRAQSRPLSPVARAYLSTALDTLEAITVRHDTISWRTIRDSAFRFASGAQKTSDTYAALAWALRRVNKHSFLQATAPGAVSEIVNGRYGYLHVPSRGGAGIALADSLHSAVRKLDSASVCGWIVDLRGNGGGNMWPMIAGVGPLLDDTIFGSFAGDDPRAGKDRWFYRDGMSGILHPNGVLDTVTRITVPPARVRDAGAPVAVLFDGGTGSSGEAMILAFRGRRNTRSFGAPSAGFATSNRGSKLPDSANMVVTSGYNLDRKGVEAGERIQPDVLIPGPPPGWPFATDDVATAAAAWLSTQPACRAAKG